MKKFCSLALIPALALAVSCGGDSSNASDQTNEETTTAAEESSALSEHTSYDFSPMGISATMMIPESGAPEVEETAWGSIEVRVGDDFGVELVPGAMTVAEHKEELDGDLVYVVEYLVDEAETVFYKKELKPNTEIEDKRERESKAEYHFFMVKEVDGELFEVKSMASMAMRKAKAQKVFEAAKTFAAKPAS